nr:protein kinase-like domain, beta-lactamase/transpeptidase-like protein [Tanacetum cinerariifolium]
MVFGEKWCQWVEICLRYSSLPIHVNGSPKEEFGLERAVRYGDPLSPFLFILAEGLNVIVNEAVSNSIVRVVNVDVNNVTVNHNKSTLYGIGVNEMELTEMTMWMGCGPFMYFGFSIGGDMRRVNAWDHMVEKFKRRLADWKENTMGSHGGKVQKTVG